jgi:LPS-assembly protein
MRILDRRRAARAVPALLLALALMLPGAGMALDFGEGPVLLIADRVTYDEEAGVVSADGNVEVARGGRRLLADLIRYEEATDIMTAEGGVVLLEPTGEVLFADRVTLSGDLEDGVVEQIRARLIDNSAFAAARGQRIDGVRTEMERATYTPCEVCEDDPDAVPLWQLRADRIQHDETSQTVVYKNAFFELFGVPVLYTPYFSHPDPATERKSGFLSPTVGSDNELGFTLETPYFFALAPNYDLTFSPIVTSKEGVVLTGEYRHLLKKGRFDLGGSITYGTEAVDDRNDVPEGDEVRGHVEGEGRFSLGNRWRGGYDIEIASDDTYLQRYGFSNQNILENRLFAERIFDRNYLAINGYGFQGLRPTDVQGRIPIVLPLAEAELVSEPQAYGARLTLDSSLVALTRTEGLDTRRVSLTGGIEKPWIGPIGDQHELRLELRGDGYYTDGDPQTFRENGSSSEFRAIPRLTYDWSWPLIGDTLGLTPLIEPVVNASIAPEGVNDDEIPNEDSLNLEFDGTNLFEADRFPGLDRVEDGGHVSYGARFGLYGEDGEWLNALFGQSYRFYGEGDEFSPASGLDSTFSDYVGRVDLSPDPWLNVRYRFRLDKNSLDLLRNEVSAFFGPRELRLDLNYLSLEDDPEADEFRQREEITAGILVRPTDRLSLRAQTRRNLRTDETVANNFGLVYRNPCIQIVAAVEQRFTENRDAGSGTRFTMRITFQNLGELMADNGIFGL